jgi:dihydrofolate reductase
VKRLSLIVAMTRGGVIGRGGTLPWRLSADLKRFKSLTMGHGVIMGRKTFASLPSTLPGRKLIVLSRQTSPDDKSISSAAIAHSLDEALELARSDNEPFVIGGGEVFREAIDRANRLYVTWVEADIEGDTYFPPWNPADWTQVESTAHAADSRNEFATTFCIYDRSS